MVLSGRLCSLPVLFEHTEKPSNTLFGVALTTGSTNDMENNACSAADRVAPESDMSGRYFRANILSSKPKIKDTAEKHSFVAYYELIATESFRYEEQ